MPLASWVKLRVDSAVASAGEHGAATAADAARIECADAVVLRVLDALEAAQGVGLVHCDVRPANIVIADGAARLVNWGASCHEGLSSSVGVAAFTESRVYWGGVTRPKWTCWLRSTRGSPSRSEVAAMRRGDSSWRLNYFSRSAHGGSATWPSSVAVRPVARTALQLESSIELAGASALARARSCVEGAPAAAAGRRLKRRARAGSR